MSAAVAWDVTPAPVRMPVRPTRPQLVSVPCGDAVMTRPAGRLRVTRAGRLAVTLTTATAAVVTTIVLASGGADASSSPVDHSTAVRPGQTLSQIAGEQLPQLPVKDAVARIQVANDLTTSQVHAGQTLLIPAVG